MSSPRLSAALILALLGGLAAGPVAAAPLNPATNCALYFAAKAQALATINSQAYPYRWFQVSVSKAAVNLTLVVTGPSGAVTYTGFQCTLNKDGSVKGGSSPY